MYARLKYFTKDSHWVKEAFTEVQSGLWKSKWWDEMEQITQRVNLEEHLTKIPEGKLSESRVKKRIKKVVANHYMLLVKSEIDQKSTLRAFPRPSDKMWFKRKEYIDNTLASRTISKIRAGNFGVGNTFEGIKDCQLCGATNMNHESHIIIKCKNLKEVREATDVAEFCRNNANLDNDSGHIILRTYLDQSWPWETP